MIKSKNTEEEKVSCVNEYLSGADKYYLSGKYSVSIRTIDRWIERIAQDKVELKNAKRADNIPIDIQKEIMDALNNNPIFYGFNTSIWNENRVINYINEKYSIKINRRMAKSLMEDSNMIDSVEYEDKVYRDLEKLDKLKYNIVLLDYIKIGRIPRKELEYLEIRNYLADKLDVNLVIARADKYVFLDVVVSEINIVEKSKNIITKANKEEQKKKYKVKISRQVRANDKHEILNKIKKEEKAKKIVFISKDDIDIKSLSRRDKDNFYFVVEDKVYDEFLQSEYEGEYVKSIANYMYDADNANRLFKDVVNISNFITGKVERYVLKVSNDKMTYLEVSENEDEKKYMIQKMREKQRKSFKTIDSNFIYNI